MALEQLMLQAWNPSILQGLAGCLAALLARMLGALLDQTLALEQLMLQAWNPRFCRPGRLGSSESSNPGGLGSQNAALAKQR